MFRPTAGRLARRRGSSIDKVPLQLHTDRSLEAGLGESLGVRDARGLIARFGPSCCLGELLGRAIAESARLTVAHDVERAALGPSHDGKPARLGLDGGDAEVLDLWKQEYRRRSHLFS